MTRMRFTRVIAIAAATMIGAASFGDDSYAIAGAALVAPNGSIQDGMAIVITDGMVEKVVPADMLPDGLDVIHRDGAVISPGLIDVDSAIGTAGRSSRTHSIDPEVTITDALDPTAASLDAALEAGITSALVTPSAVNLVCGTTAFIRTHADGSAVDVVVADGSMLLGFGASTWRNDTEPTSRSGALFLLRGILSNAEGRMKSVVDGDLPVVAVCGDAQDVSGALRTLARRGIVPLVVLGSGAIDVAEELAASDAGAVVGPLSMSSGRRALSGPAALEGHGVDVAFSSGAPGRHPEELRMTAALAVRHGMSPEAARRGLTSAAAHLCGVADVVGSLEAGRAADLVVWSADPLRPDARVLEVYVKGVRVHAHDGAHGGHDDA